MNKIMNICRKFKIIRILYLSVLLFLFIILSCNPKNIGNSQETNFITTETPNQRIIDSLSELECDCYKQALEIPDDNKMKLYGLNCNSILIKYLASCKYKNADTDLKRKYEIQVFELTGKKLAEICQSSFTFLSQLNVERETKQNLINNPELVELVKMGKFKNMELDENTLVTIDENSSRTDFIDLDYYSSSRIDWVNEFEYYLIFEETNHPLYSWINKGDTTLVRIIDIRDSIIEYDMIRKRLIYPGIMKKID
jgi:hypothetical protein